jgi:ECF sigma factor
VPAAVRSLADELVPLLYAELKRVARRERARVGAGMTMQTTTLVNEAYLKLRAAKGWNDDAHFLRAAALAMRHVLVNHAEARAGPIRLTSLGTERELILIPSGTSGRRIDAPSPTMRKSQDAASAQPQPMQYPSTATIVTGSISSQALHISGPRSTASRNSSKDGGIAASASLADRAHKPCLRT